MSDGGLPFDRCTTDILNSLGYSYEHALKEIKTTCVECGKADHLFINRVDGACVCHKCGFAGGYMKFVKAVYNFVSEEIDQTKAIEALVERRKLKKNDDWFELFSGCIVCLQEDPNNATYLIRCNPEENIYAHFNPSVSKTVYNFPKHSIGVFRPYMSKKEMMKQKTIKITEGLWDYLVLCYVTGEQDGIIGLAGATNINEDYLSIMRGKTVAGFLDNDDAGRKGIIKLKQKLGADFMYFDWTRILGEEEAKSQEYQGYDLGDLFVDSGHDADEVFDILSDKDCFSNSLVLTSDMDARVKDEEESAAYKRTSIDQIIKDMKSCLYTTPYFEGAVKTAFATVVSPWFRNSSPVWMFMYGPSGSGKSTILEIFDRSKDFAMYQTSLKSTSLMSGRRAEEGEDEASLLDQLDGKCLIVKDYTTVMSMASQAQDEMYGLLREAFDGSIDRQYGNGKRFSVENLKFSCLFGCTDEILKDERANLGERFLRYDIIDASDPSFREACIRMAATGNSEYKQLLPIIAKGVKYFLNHLKYYGPSELPPVDSKVIDKIIALSDLTSRMRSKIQRTDRFTKAQAIRHRPEVGTRLATQLVQQGQCLAFVCKQPKFTMEDYSILYKTAMDTMNSFRLEIAEYVYLNAVGKTDSTGVSVPSMVGEMRTSMPTIRGNLSELQEMGLMYSGDYSKKGTTGHRTLWQLHPEIRDLWDRAYPND